ncbi:MAG: hypothetical protein A4E50_01079 [Methanosaeta sp. PtaB.Bin087]|nr:MAG: hypothetical protein A4E50_01079 [Methanosaeta sp. PtaB.Bin087]
MVCVGSGVEDRHGNALAVVILDGKAGVGPGAVPHRRLSQNLELLVLINPLHPRRPSEACQLLFRDDHGGSGKDPELVRPPLQGGVLLDEDYHPQFLILRILEGVLDPVGVEVPVVEDLQDQVGVPDGVPGPVDGDDIDPVVAWGEVRAAPARVPAGPGEVDHRYEPAPHLGVDRLHRHVVVNPGADLDLGVPPLHYLRQDVGILDRRRLDIVFRAEDRVQPLEEPGGWDLLGLGDGDGDGRAAGGCPDDRRQGEKKEGAMPAHLLVLRLYRINNFPAF